METRHYDQFKRLLSSGRKTEAKAALGRFLESFGSFDEKRLWTRAFFDAGELGHRIRHEIYQEILFPVLRDGYEVRDLWSTRWLARTAQNLYSATRLHEQIGFKTAHDLFKECYLLDPQSADVRADLLGSLIDRFGRCLHVWPAGVLYGMDGATFEECGELLEEASLARTLDIDGKHLKFIEECETKVSIYRATLRP